MDRINEKIVKSPNTPNSKEVLWLDTSAEQSVLKHFISGSWKAIAGGGGGGTGAVDSVIVKNSVTELDADVNTYYVFENEVNTLAITLPEVTDTTYISKVVWLLSAGSSPNITFITEDEVPVIKQDNFTIEAANAYEITAVFNGVSWIVTLVKLYTGIKYGDVITDLDQINLSGGESTQLGVKLTSAPNVEEIISVSSDISVLSITNSTLTFNSQNWDTYQYVTITNANTTLENYKGVVSLKRNDTLLTEVTRKAKAGVAPYEHFVDTTIPDGIVTLTADDFQDTWAAGDYIKLGKYIGSATNVRVPEKINDKTCWVIPGTTFTNNTNIKYVTFDDNVIYRGASSTSGCAAVEMFSGCTNLVGVSNMNPAVTNLSNTFYGCTKFKFVDNLDELVNVTKLYQTFMNSGIEYIQDLSGMTNLVEIANAFQDTNSLLYIYGFPTNISASFEGSVQSMYSSTTSSNLKIAYIPVGSTNLRLACYKANHLKEILIYEDNLASIDSTFLYTDSSILDVTIRCNPNTDTYTALMNRYGTSSKVKIIPFGQEEELPSIVVWGDSISSPNTSWIEWPKRLLQKVNGYVLKNNAISGEYSTSTLGRQGGYPVTVETAFTIPADTTPVENLSVVVNGRDDYFTAGADYCPCSISGVSGTLVRVGTNNYRFTRSKAGSAVSVSAGTAITSDDDAVLNSSQNVMLFYLNGNKGWDDNAEKLLDMFKKAVQHFTSLGGTKYIVAGPATGPAMRTTHQLEQLAIFEPAAAEEFGEHWLNLREYEITNGLSQNELTASSLDTERMEDGFVPASILGGGSPDNILMYGTNSTDDTHPNVYGANTICLAFYQKGVALGYWN